MIRNYVKIALRNLWRNRFYSSVNIVGLSLAIACALIAYLNYDFATHFDSFHPNADQLYRVLAVRTINQQHIFWGRTPLPMRKSLLEESPSVQRAVSVERAGVNIKVGDQIFEEAVLFADDGFFEMFNFPLKVGYTDLKEKHFIVLSEESARKYFGEETPIGKPLTLLFGNRLRQVLTVTGVADKIPHNSSIRFELLVSSELLLDAGLNQAGDWKYSVDGLFVQIADPENVPKVEEQMKRYVPIQNESNPRTPFSSFILERPQDAAIHAHDIRSYGLERPYPPSQTIGIAVMAFLILALSCFNFVNTSLAIATKRFKEIGIRKVVGSLRSQLIVQYLSENTVLCLFALVGALLLTTLLLPAYNSIFPENQLELNILNDWGALLFLLGILILTGIGAGLYPAFVISRCSPSSILREKQKAGRVGLLMRALLALQFALSIIAVVGGIVFRQNALYLNDFDLGYQKEDIVTLLIDAKGFPVYRDAIQNHTRIESISGCQRHMIYSGARRSVRYLESEREAFFYGIGFNYLETMQIRMKEGRRFDEAIRSDIDQSVIVNETMMKEMNWKSAVGKTITLENKSYQVIGMIEDVYSQGPWEPIMPSVLRACPPEEYTMMQIRVQRGNLRETLEFLQTTWAKVFPDVPFTGVFENQSIAEALRLNDSVNKVFTFNALASMFVSAMGLFALVSLTVASRTKEVGIRKVLGASVPGLVFIILREFVIVLVVAMVIADIGAFVLIGSLLDAIYAYHTNIGGMALLIGNILVFVVGIGTVIYQTTKTAMANPIQALRYE